MFQPIQIIERCGITLLFIVMALALSGCQSFTRNLQTPYTAAEQQRLLPTLKHWKAEGKISFKMGSDRQSANFQWQQFNKNYSIHIFGPFGVGATWLKRSSRGVVLENAKLGKHKASTAEELMQGLIGWQVPVSNMQYWIKGTAAPGNKHHTTPITTYDPQGRLTQLEQQGWQVVIKEYQQQGRWQLPRKIIATRENMRLLVVIKTWEPRTSSFWH